MKYLLYGTKETVFDMMLELIFSCPNLCFPTQELSPFFFWFWQLTVPFYRRFFELAMYNQIFSVLKLRKQLPCQLTGDNINKFIDHFL